MFGIGDGPSPLPGFDGLIFTPQAPFEAAITMWALFVTFLLLLFAEARSAYWGMGRDGYSLTHQCTHPIMSKHINSQPRVF